MGQRWTLFLALPPCLLADLQRYFLPPSPPPRPVFPLPFLRCSHRFCRMPTGLLRPRIRAMPRGGSWLKNSTTGITPLCLHDGRTMGGAAVAVLFRLRYHIGAAMGDIRCHVVAPQTTPHHVEETKRKTGGIQQ